MRGMISFPGSEVAGLRCLNRLPPDGFGLIPASLFNGRVALFEPDGKSTNSLADNGVKRALLDFDRGDKLDFACGNY
jgi:hypothetical protein